MEQVKQIVESGVRVSTAVKESLLAKGLTVVAFAEKHDLPAKTVYNAIAGSQRAGDRILVALASELGGTPDEWAVLLWQAAKPAAAVNE